MLEGLKSFVGTIMETEASLLRKENAELRSKNAALEKALTENCSQIDDLKQDLQRANKRYAKLEESLAAEEVEKLKNEHWRMKRERDDAIREKEEVKQEIETFKKLNDELREKLQELADIQVENWSKVDKERMQERALATLESNDLIGYGSLDELELSVRTYNALRRSCGISTVQELLRYQMSYLLEHARNFGKSSANELYVELAERGLRLEEEDDMQTKRRIERILAPARRTLAKVDEMGLTPEQYDLLKQCNLLTAERLHYYSKASLLANLHDAELVDKLDEWMHAKGFSLRKD